MKAVNGIDSWIETHYEVVKFLTETADYSGTLSNKTREKQGTGGLYELSTKLTDEFEELNNGRLWDGEFFDEIDDYLTSVNKR